MTLSLPKPSNRLLRAAAAEHAGLARHRERLAEERDQLLVELRHLDNALAAADQRLRVLAQLKEADEPSTAGPAPDDPTSARADTPEPQDRDDHRSVLQGPAIREAAVHVLVAQPEHIEALHYRRWYELVQHAGYAVAGKDPLAVFLTQVSRSPVVRKTTEPGVYEIDRQAPLRIRQRLERLQAELREAALSPHAPVELASIRARRHELDLAISQHERALEEALRVLGSDEPGAAVGATG